MGFSDLALSKSVVFLLGEAPRVPSIDSYFATKSSWKTLRFCLKCQSKVSGEWIEKMRVNEIFSIHWDIDFSSVHFFYSFVNCKQ